MQNKTSSTQIILMLFAISWIIYLIIPNPKPTRALNYSQLSSDTSTQLLDAYKEHPFETDDTAFYNGEILLPDYVNMDTLIVTDANYLNWAMNKFNPGSDGDIMEILKEGTIPYQSISNLCVVKGALREYQMDANQDGSLTIYDGERVVGVLPYDSTSKLSQLIDNDNQ